MNVGGLYAAAGQVSTADFTSGRVHFTDLTGDVRNDGVLAADNSIALLGVNVVNNGTAGSASGTVMMASGQDVYVGTRGSNIFVQANGRPAASGTTGVSSPAAGSITNGGTVAAPRVVMGAGDMYSTAIVNSGLLRSHSITVNAGQNGSAAIGGRLDASSAGNPQAGGQGGSIQVLGGKVALQGAALDASGGSGGGSVRVGGDLHGGGTLLHAQTTTVDAATTINVDGTGAASTGGTAVLWSDAATDFAGQISARGGAAGGAVEVSSHDTLTYAGFTDLRATTAGGTPGSLLLDPTNITIAATGTTNISLTGGTVSFAETPANATITTTSLGLALASGTLTLQAVNDIDFSAYAAVTGAAGNLVLQAGHSIDFAFNASLNLVSGSFTATVADPHAAMYNPAAGGTFTMATGSTIKAGGGITIQGGPISATSLSTQALGGLTSGNIVLNSGTSPEAGVSANTLDSSASGLGASGGNISISSSGPVSVTGTLNTSAGFGAGGKLIIGPDAGATAPTSITIPLPQTTGSPAPNSGDITLTTTGVIQFPSSPVTFTGNTSLTAASVAPAALNGGGFNLSLNLSTEQVALSNISNINNFLSNGAGGTLADVSFTTTGSQTYGSTLTLGTDVTLTSSGGGGISFAGISSPGTAYSLETDTPGQTVFKGPVGTVGAPLSELIVDGPTILNGPSVTTGGGGQFYEYTVTLAAPSTTLTDTAGGSIIFSAAVGGSTVGGQALTLSTTGSQELDGAVGTAALPLASFQSGLGTLFLAGGSVYTSAGGQSYTGPVVLGSDTTLTDLNKGNITFGNTVDSDGPDDDGAYRVLTLLTNGTMTFQGNVGTGQALASLTTGGTGYTTGTTLFSATAAPLLVETTVGGAQTYNNPVLIGSDTTLESAGGESTDGSITFASTVDESHAVGVTTPAYTLTVNTPGNTVFSGIVGGKAPLLGLVTDTFGSTTGQTQFTINVTGQAAGIGGVNLGSGGLTVNDTAVFNVTGSSSAKVPTDVTGAAVATNNPSVATTGALTLNNNVAVLDQDTVLVGASLTTLGINGTPTGGTAHGLVLDLSGQAVQVSSDLFFGISNFASVGAGGTDLAGDFTTPGYQYYGSNGVPANGMTAAIPLSNTTLTADTTLTSSGGKNIFFAGPLDGAYALTIQTTGGTYFDGLVGSAVGGALTGLTVDDGAGTTGATHFNMSLTGQPSGTAGVNVAGAVLIAGPVTFDVPGSVAGTHPTVQTTGGQEYDQAATLDADTVLNDTGGGQIFFSSTVDGAANLTLNTAGEETLEGTVGGTTALTSLTTLGAGSLFIGGDAITTSGGGQTYGNAVSLGAFATLTDTGSGPIHFQNVINPSEGGLTVLTNGATTFDQTVSELLYLTVGGTGYTAGTTVFNVTGGVAVTTYGGPDSGGPAQSYNNAVVLAQPTTLEDAIGGSIVFNGTINSAAPVMGHPLVQQSLTISTSGPTTFTQPVGAAYPLLGLTTGQGGGGGTTFSMSALNATPGVGGVNLGTDGLTVYDQATFAVTNSASPKVPASFTGVVNPANNPSVASAGPIQLFGNQTLLAQDTVLVASSLIADAGFNGTPTAGGASSGLTLDIGAGVYVPEIPLAGLSNFASVGAGGTDLTGGTITTSGYQYYGNNGTLPGLPLSLTVLTGDTTLHSTGGAPIGFGGPLDGGFALTVATAGSTSFNGVVGGSAALASLTVDNGSTATTGTTFFDMSVAGLAAGTGGVNVSGGGVTINGPVVFGVTGGGSNATPSVLSSGGQTYNGAATLDADTVLTNTTIDFRSTVDGTYNLTLNSVGDEIFEDSVGATNHLLSLTTNATGNLPTGTVIFGTASGPQTPLTVTAYNASAPAGNPAQTYNNPVILERPVVLNGTPSTGAGAIVFDEAISSSAYTPLTINTADNVTFNGPVGNTGTLSSLIVTAGNGGTFFTDLNNAGLVPGIGIVSVGSLTINGPTTFAAVTDLLTLNQATVSSTGAQTYNGSVTISQPTSLYSSGGADLTFNGPVSGAADLALDTAGNEIFQGVGSTVTLPGLAIDTLLAPALLPGGGATQFNMSVSNAPAVTVGAGGLTINDAVRFGMTGSSLAYPSVLALAGGTQTYNGAATVAVNTWLVGDSAAAFTPGTYTAGGAIAFGSTVTGATGTLPSLTILTSAGPTVFGSTVSVGTLDVTGAQVTLAGAVSGLSSLTIAPNGGAAGGTITLSAGTPGGVDTVVTSGGQTYGSAVALGSDVVLTDTGGKNIDFASTLDGAFNLTVNTAGATIFGGAVGGGTPLLSLTTDAPGITEINGGLVSTSVAGLAGPGGEQFYHDKVILGADTVLSAVSSPGLTGVTFGGTVDSASAAVPRSLSITATGIEFDGAVGGGAPLLSLATAGDGLTLLNAGSVQTSTFQSYGSTGGTLIGQPTILTAGTDLAFLTTVAGSGAISPDSSLTLDAPGLITFGAAVGTTTPLTSLTVNGGTLQLNGGSVSTVLGQTYNAPVVLGASAVLTSASIAGPDDNVVFNSTLDGSYALAINTGGLTQFNAQIGGTAALASLTTDNEGQPGEGTQFIIPRLTAGSPNPAGVNVLGAVTINDPVLIAVAGGSIAQPSVQSGGAQTYGGAATLGADTVLASTGNGTLAFGRTVDGQFNLTLITGGGAVFGGFAGGNVPLASLTVNTGGTTAINGGGITTAGSGAQTYNGAVLLGADAVLTSQMGGDLRFNSTVDGAVALTLNTGGQTVFNGLVGSGAPLASLTTDAPGATQFNMAVGSAPAGVLVSGPVTINDAVTFNVAGSSLQQPSILTLGNNAQTYASAVSLAADTVLTSALALPAAGAGFTGGGAIVLGSPAGIASTGGSNLFVRAGVGAATFGAALNVASLDLGGAQVTITGPVQLPGLLSVESNAGAGGSLVLNGGSLTTAGAQTYNAAVFLGADTQFNIANPAGGGDIVFNSTLDGAHAVALNTPGNVVFNGLVGSMTPLASLTVTATGLPGSATFFNMDASGAAAGVNVSGAVLVNGAVTFNVGGSSLGGSGPASVLTGGTQTYLGAATLSQDTSLVSTGGGNLVFGSTLDGSHGLALSSAGDEDFNGLVGSRVALGSLTTDASNLPSTAGGTTRFLIDATGSAAGVTVSGPLTLNDSVVFNVTGGNQVSVSTAGAQTYNGAVMLGADTVLTSTTQGNLVFNAPMDGAHALTLNTAGTTIFAAAIGGLSPLASLTTDAPGATVFSRSGNVTTSGAQTYGDAVLLQTDATLLSSASNIAFLQTVDGAHALTTSASGTNLFGGAVGDTTPLASVTVSSGTTLMGGQRVTTAGFQTYDGAVTLEAPTTLASQSAAGTNAITFQQTIDGANALALNTAGATTFMGLVGGATPLLSVTTTGPSVFIAGGASVATSSNQSYGGAVTLGTNANTFTSTGAGVAFQESVDGGSALTIRSPGQSALNGNVGAVTPLTSLTVAAPLSVGASTVSTQGDQEYQNTVSTTTAGTTQMTASAGDVRFDADVTAGGGLTVVANRIGSAGNITTANNLDLEAVAENGRLTPLLLLTGQNYSAGGNLELNTAAASTPSDPSAATIILSNPGTVTFRGANFTMGYLQKLFSLGTVHIDLGRGVATVGDIAARYNLVIRASEVVLLDRPAITNAGGSNDGLNFAADDSIDFGSARVAFGGPGTNRVANFVTTGSNIVIERIAGISLFKDPTLDKQFQISQPLGLNDLDDINNTGSSVPQPVRGGTQSLDTAAALSGALPDQKPVDVAVDITISASQMEELKKLGIHPRLAQRAERGSANSKRALFAQLVDGQDMENYGRLQPIKGGVSRLEPSDYVVVVDRMGEREVQSILLSFENLYGKNKEKAPIIGGAFQDAFNDYTVAKQTADPAGFGAYLEGQPGKYPAVETSVRGFDDLFGHIEHLGLTDKEVAKSEEHITSDLGVSGVSPEDMVKVINALRKKLPPAQKAASTKALPSAPASSPAPNAAPNKMVPAPGPAAPAVAPSPAASPAPDSAIPEVPALPEPPSPEMPPPAPTPTTTPPLGENQKPVLKTASRSVDEHRKPSRRKLTARPNQQRKFAVR